MSGEEKDALDEVFDAWAKMYFDRVLLTVALVVGLVVVSVDVGRMVFAHLFPLHMYIGRAGLRGVLKETTA